MTRVKLRTAAATLAAAVALLSFMVAVGPSAQAATPATTTHVTTTPAALELKAVPRAKVVHSAVNPSITGFAVTIYSRYSVTTNQCLDADINGSGVGTKVQAWTCNGTNEQTWILWTNLTITNMYFGTNYCLDADTNGGGNNGTKVQLWTCSAGATQQEWDTYLYSTDRAIYNVRFHTVNGNTMVVDRDTNTPGNGAQAQLWTRNFQSQQWWQKSPDVGIHQ